MNYSYDILVLYCTPVEYKCINTSILVYKCHWPLVHIPVKLRTEECVGLDSNAIIKEINLFSGLIDYNLQFLSCYCVLENLVSLSLHLLLHWSMMSSKLVMINTQLAICERNTHTDSVSTLTLACSSTQIKYAGRHIKLKHQII